MGSRGKGVGSLGANELRSIVESAPWAVAVVDHDFRYLLCSSRWLLDHSLTKQDTVGTCHWDLFPEPNAEWRARHQRVLLGTEEISEEVLVTRKHGAEDWVSWQARPWVTDAGEIGGVVLVSQITTSARRAEEQLRQSNTRLEEAQRLARIGYWEWNLEKDLITWSREVYDLFGVDPNRRPLSYADYFAAVPAEEQAQVTEHTQKALSGAMPFYFEHRIVRPDGTERHVAIDGRIERGEDGQPHTLLGAAQDVTERRELEEQLTRSQKLEATGRLAGGVAHDFNNILTAVFSFADFALEDLGDRHPVRRDIEEIIAAAGRAKSLTQQLLAFSRQQPVMPRVVNINAHVTNIEEMIRRILGEDIAFATHLCADLWHARVDPSALEQVIVNLAVNARDAMPGGGHLTLETSNVVLGSSETGAKGFRIPAGEYVAFIISDDGEGMNPEVRDRIFEPFFTTKGPGRGTGLGLSTCYGIIRQANGFLWVYSEPNRGTTFKVYLPRIFDAFDKEPARNRPKLQGGQERVLIAEDNAQVRDIARRTLQALGYDVIVGSTGQDALDTAALTGLPIDLLLTDVVMPGMTGKELADQVCMRCPDVRVLYMSGYTENTILHHGVLEAGIELLQKPFEPSNLGERVRQVLDDSPPWRERGERQT